MGGYNDPKKNILENLVRTENPKISSKDLVRTENLKDILKRFGADRKSKRYPQKIWDWTKDPEVIIERFGVGQMVQKLSSKDLGLDKRSKVNLERVWSGQRAKS